MYITRDSNQVYKNKNSAMSDYTYLINNYKNDYDNDIINSTTYNTVIKSLKNEFYFLQPCDNKMINKKQLKKYRKNAIKNCDSWIGVDFNQLARLACILSDKT